MGLDGLTRVIVHSFWVAWALGLAIGLPFGWEPGFGFAFGAAWSALNLWMLKGLLHEAFGESRALAIFAWLQGKVLLYVTGAIVLINIPLSILAAIAGFHLPFLFALLGSIYYQGRSSSPSQHGSKRS